MSVSRAGRKKVRDLISRLKEHGYHMQPKGEIALKPDDLLAAAAGLEAAMRVDASAVVSAVEDWE